MKELGDILCWKTRLVDCMCCVIGAVGSVGECLSTASCFA